MLQLYTWEPNSNSGKPIFALKEKGVVYEYHYVNLTEFEQHGPEYVAINPAGTVPTLIHDGRILTESTPMCEYIDAAFQGVSLRPHDPLGRYRMRWWCQYVDTTFAPALSVIGWHLFMGPMVRRKSPQELEQLIARIPTKERQIAWRTAAGATFTSEQLSNARARVGESIKAFDDRLGESPYLAGPEYSIADIVTFANAYALPLTVPEYANLKKAPRYIDWLRRIYARPAIKEAFAASRSLGQRATEVAAQLGV